MTRRLAAALAVAFLLTAPTSADATQGLHGGGGGRAPLLVPNTPQVSNTLRALDRLARYGYSVGSPARADRAIRAWQRSNGLVTDGIVGVQTLASLGLTAVASAPAVRVDPPVAASTPPVGDVCAEMSAYRQAAGLPDVFDAIGYRESRCRNDVTSSTGCCFAYWQNYLSSHLSRQSAYRERIINECGVTAVADIRGLSDAQKRASACVTFVVWSISGMSPWGMG